MPRKHGNDHWTRRHPERVARGATHPSAKLTSAQIAEMCDRYRRYHPHQAGMARHYSVSRMTIWRKLKAAGLI